MLGSLWAGRYTVVYMPRLPCAEREGSDSRAFMTGPLHEAVITSNSASLCGVAGSEIPCDVVDQ